MTRRLGFAAVASAAKGRWGEILPALGVAPEYLLDRHGPCPGCGGRDRWRYDDRDGRGTWYCSGGGEPAYGDGFDALVHVHGWSRSEALRAVAGYLDMEPSTDRPPACRRPPVPPPSITSRKQDAVRDCLRAAWRAAVPLDAAEAAPARAYLVGRGLGDILAGPPADLRVELAAPYYLPPATAGGRPRLVGHWPALLAVVRAVDGRGVASHRTYLDPAGAGKAAITDPDTGRPAPARKLRTLVPGASRGAAIRLYPAAETIILAEGVETALAARIAIPELPVWAAVSAGGIARLRVPAEVREIIVAADHDAHGAGERGAMDLARRMRGYGVVVRMAMPPTVDADWADVLAASSAAGADHG